MKPPAISRPVHPLAQRGLLSRLRSGTDRREVRLRATADKLAVLGECQPLLEQASARFLQPLGKTRAPSFIRAATALLDAAT